MNRTIVSFRTEAVVILLALAAASPGAAAAVQTTPADSVIALSPITVTVLRTPFELNQAPYAVAVVGQDAIRLARPGLALDEALRTVPGVQVDNRYNYALGERISMRGFGARAQFGVRGVKVLIDGIPATMPDGQTTLNHVNPSTLGRIEVIRGPASTVYGNAAGGVIQLHSAEPPDMPFQQAIRVISGEDGLLRTEATTSGRQGNTSYMVNLNRLNYDGYRDSHKPESTRFSNSAENYQASAHFGHRGARTQLNTWLHFVDYDARNPGSLSATLLAANRNQAFINNVNQKTGEKGRHAQLGASWNRSMQSGQLEVAGYVLNRSLDNPIPNEIIDLERNAGGLRLSYTRDLAAGQRAVNLAIGAEVDAQLDDRQRYVNSQGTRGNKTLDQEETVLSLGAAAQATAPLGDLLELVAALRYDRARFEADDRLITSTNPDDSGVRVMNALSPSVGVLLAVADAFHPYANVATSFETPTTTELVNRPSGAGGFNPEIDPQRTYSVETGAKGRLLGRAAYQLALYYARVHDQLIPFEIPAAPGRQFFKNAGSATHKGAELGISLAVADFLSTQIAYTYTDARFRTYITSTGLRRDGKRVPGIAKNRLSGLVSLRAPWGTFADIETRYVSRMAADDGNANYSGAYAVTDVRAGLRERRIGSLDVSPFIGVTNLFDRKYNTSVTINAFGGRYYEPGPGTKVYVGGDIRFPVR
ncbi:MAG: TonB-dependent receptor [Gemmatimonadetes bacterium]|nr:TonB-dependent receptor [Gemmatimonadota bacterium]